MGITEKILSSRKREREKSGKVLQVSKYNLSGLFASPAISLKSCFQVVFSQRISYGTSVYTSAG